jgi:isopentenyl-diphosphate delta-isomerase
MINVAGAGGTSWPRVELMRKGSKNLQRFADSGIPTVIALASTLRATKKPVIVSGGVRSGVDIAKSLVMGANYAAAALPFLVAWKENRLNETIKKWKEELKTTMLLMGSRDIAELKKQDMYLIGTTGDYLSSAGLM